MSISNKQSMMLEVTQSKANLSPKKSSHNCINEDLSQVDYNKTIDRTKIPN